MRIFIASLVAVCLSASSAYAATDQVAAGMGQKAIRGAVNFVTGIVEVPMQIYKGYTNGFPMIENTAGSKTVGTILGFFRGFGHAAGRMGWGGLELFGFWTANPTDNVGVGIPFDAEYAWGWGEQYSYFKPTFAEGIKPVGQKLVHGVANSFLGIAELPGQTIKGASEGNALKGFGKGMWFWWSRELYGFSGIWGCLVPNPADNPGYPFNGQWPWSALLEKSA